MLFRSARIMHTVVPGTADLTEGRLWRGYVTVLLVAFVALVGRFQWRGTKTGMPAVGFVSEMWTSGWMGAFPLPTAPGLTGASGAVSYWTVFWVYPYAKIFWAAVALALVVAITLHALSVRRIWKQPKDVTAAV